MKKSYRLHQEGLYRDALKAARVQVKKVTAHKDGSATIPSNEKIVAQVKGLPGVVVLAEGKTEITFSLPAALEWHKENPPNFTQEQRNEQKAERDARKTAREAKRLAQGEGDEGDDDGDEPDGDEEDSSEDQSE